MPTLNISEFSCLHDASFALAPLNVIIGPQGSGKSVTTKLFYFFSDILSSCMQYAERGEELETVKRVLAKQFSVWFPPSAWGNGRFNINYVAGAFSVRILRKKYRNELSEDVTVKFSEWFNEFYATMVGLFDRARGDESEVDLNVQFSASLDRQWRTREVITRRLNATLGSEYLAQQTFIPAGRAFFTSIGRLMAGFEQAGSLDPVTIKFARLFATLLDRNARRVSTRPSRLGAEALARRSDFMKRLFGGEIRFEDEAAFVETTDGRKVPFQALSSGQQELLPMWSLMDYFSELDAVTGEQTSRRLKRELVYIEEPEAHLFPSAQSLLMEFLIGNVVSERNRRSLIITTHSPYIMSKLNVFLKAGQLSRRKKKNSEINDVVPRECWLNTSQQSAFAIEDGKLSSIIDEDGLIDGRYLDSISEDLSVEFSKLLMIESEISNG